MKRARAPKAPRTRPAYGWHPSAEDAIRANMGLVGSIAKRFEAVAGIDHEDLMQEGRIALLIAHGKYNPGKAKFSTYAAFWILQRLIAHCRRRHLVHIPANVHSIAGKLAKRLAEEDADGRTRDALNAMGPPVSFGTSLFEDGAPFDMADENTEDPLASLCAAQDARALRLALLELPARERSFLVDRFGLDGGGGMTLDELGAKHGICRERARQICAAALGRLGRDKRLRKAVA